MPEHDDGAIRVLERRVDELQKRNTQLEVARKEMRRRAEKAEADFAAATKDLDAARAQIDAGAKDVAERIAALEAERDQYKARAEAPPDDRILELEGRLRAREVEDKFAGLKDQLVDGLTVKDLWKLHDFDPAKTDPAAVDVDGLVKGWKESRPGAFKPEGSGSTPAQGSAGKSPLRVAEAPSRGARDSVTTDVKISRSMMREPGWMTKHKAEAAAFQSGQYTLTDD